MVVPLLKFLTAGSESCCSNCLYNRSSCNWWRSTIYSIRRCGYYDSRWCWKLPTSSSHSRFCQVSKFGNQIDGRAKALTASFNNDPAKASRPFDASRSGFVIAEGAGSIILEELSHARKRGARIYAEVLGYGLSSDAHHMTAPPIDGQGAYLSMTRALKHARKSPRDVAYINAHATSTPLGDKAENRAIRRLMCDDGGLDSKEVRVSSSKGATGHLLGAAGSVEAIFTILALHHVWLHLNWHWSQGILPPTINFEKHDEENQEEWDCDYLVNEAKNVDLQEEGRNVALTNSFGFGGVNASLAFGRFTY